MPFTTLNTITPFTHPGILNYLGANEGANFTAVEAQAAIIVRDITGRSIPADADDSPDWIHLPMAQIISKIAAPKLKDLSPEAYDRFEKDYEAALENLKEHPVIDADTGEPSLQDRSTSTVRSINNLYEF